MTASVTGGSVLKSHYNNADQLMWTRDECGRQTDYEYEYRGGLLKTTYPAVNSVRKFTENHYLECCGKLS